MSEIKSTMDIVMERTRHLSLSEEEKARHKQEEFKKRLGGLLAQYEDGLLPAAKLQERIDALRNEIAVEDRRAVMDILADRVDPDGDNKRVFELLADWAPDLHDALEKILTDHREQRTALVDKTLERLRDELRREDIEGSAVVPNPEKDPSYREHLNDRRRETIARIKAVL
ncbi:MAG: hypothetical protein AVO39_08025 [delta proteobacterium MLS_D]|jgi:hypothetical protein|nr:MAG: hypothetical protein AVO39_08025 [delta proteobacterium MLS_D]